MGDRVEVVLRVPCRTVLEDKFAAMLKLRPPKQSHNALWDNYLDSVSRATSKWGIGNYEIARESGTKFVPPNSSIIQFDSKVKAERLFTMAGALSLPSYSHSTQITRNKLSKPHITGLKTPTRRQEAQSCLTKSMVEDLNSGRQRINQASDQNGTRIRDRLIVSPTRWALSHAASLWCLLNAGFTVLTLSLFNLAVSVLM